MVLAIDPSINDVGVALLATKGEYEKSWHIKTKKLANSKTKLEHIVEELSDILATIENLEFILIEHTRFFSHNKHTSHASAQKLNLAKGALFGACRSLTQVPVHLIWIPGFSKNNAQLLARSFKLPSSISQHELDAFWLGNTWVNCSLMAKQQLLDQQDL